MPDLDHYAALEDTSAVSAATGGIQQDAVSALVALGYGNTEALKAAVSYTHLFQYPEAIRDMQECM